MKWLWIIGMLHHEAQPTYLHIMYICFTFLIVFLKVFLLDCIREIISRIFAITIVRIVE